MISKCSNCGRTEFRHDTFMDSSLKCKKFIPQSEKCKICGNPKDRHPLREGFKCEKFIPEDDFCKCKTCGFPEYVEEGSVGRICECEKFIPIEMIPVVYSGEYIIKEKKDCEDDCRCVTGGHGGYVYCPIHSKKEKKGCGKLYNPNPLKKLLKVTCGYLDYSCPSVTHRQSSSQSFFSFIIYSPL